MDASPGWLLGSGQVRREQPARRFAAGVPLTVTGPGIGRSRPGIGRIVAGLPATMGLLQPGKVPGSGVSVLAFGGLVVAGWGRVPRGCSTGIGRWSGYQG